MTTDKRFWMRIAAGTVAIIAVACGCSDKKETGCENAEVVAALDRIEAGVDGLREDTKYIKEDRLTPLLWGWPALMPQGCTLLCLP